MRPKRRKKHTGRGGDPVHRYSYYRDRTNVNKVNGSKRYCGSTSKHYLEKCRKHWAVLEARHHRIDDGCAPLEAFFFASR